MGTPHDPLAAERRRLTDLIGSRENTEALFSPKARDEDVRDSGLLVLQRLNFVSGTNSLYFNCQSLADAQIAEWGPRMWVNTLSHLAVSDAEVRAIPVDHGSSMPEDEAARVTLMRKVHTAFVFFLWIVASPTRPADPRNMCVLKLVLLQDAILMENINAIRDGAAGCWGWLDKSIAGIREIGDAFEIRRIKAVATNERVYRAFLKRGFGDAAPIPGLERHVVEYARSVECSW